MATLQPPTPQGLSRVRVRLRWEGILRLRRWILEGLIPVVEVARRFQPRERSQSTAIWPLMDMRLQLRLQALLALKGKSEQAPPLRRLNWRLPARPQLRYIFIQQGQKWGGAYK